MPPSGELKTIERQIAVGMCIRYFRLTITLTRLTIQTYYKCVIIFSVRKLIR